MLHIYNVQCTVHQHANKLQGAHTLLHAVLAAETHRV